MAVYPSFPPSTFAGNMTGTPYGSGGRTPNQLTGQPGMQVGTAPPTGFTPGGGMQFASMPPAFPPPGTQTGGQMAGPPPAFPPPGTQTGGQMAGLPSPQMRVNMLRRFFRR